MEALVREAGLLAATIVAFAVEITDLELVHTPASPLSPMEASLSILEILSSTMVLRRQPPFAYLDRPLEMEFSIEELTPGLNTAMSAALCLSTHAQLLLHLEGGALGRVSVVAPLLVHATATGWSARALVLPSCWSGCGPIVLDSLSIAGRYLPCVGLPATLTVFDYNHNIAAAGAVHAAAKAGDVPALLAALSAGGSTEERGLDSRTGLWWAACNGHLEAVRVLLNAGATASPGEVVRRLQVRVGLGGLTTVR